MDIYKCPKLQKSKLLRSENQVKRKVKAFDYGENKKIEFNYLNK
jgi:hypothetical protein